MACELGFFAAAFVIVVKARVFYRFQKDEKLTRNIMSKLFDTT